MPPAVLQNSLRCQLSAVPTVICPGRRTPLSTSTARFSSPLSVDDFVKKTQFIYYTREALADAAPRIADFAEREGLHGHARSALSRTEEKGE